MIAVVPMADLHQTIAEQARTPLSMWPLGEGLVVETSSCILCLLVRISEDLRIFDPRGTHKGKGKEKGTLRN